MKAKVLFVAALVASLTFSACKSTKQYAQQTGNVEIALPCAGVDKDSEEYFAGMGVGENVNIQNSRMAALEGAKQIVNAKIGGLARGLAADYSRTMNGSAAQQDVRGIVEREIVNVVERMMNDVEQTCEKVYQTPSGTYQSHIAIRISKKEIVRKTSDALGADEKMETLFNRDQFRKWAEEYMKGYEASK
ncbi:MAG: hypothetical protein KBT04_03950 [Bacteroidales bacterium]|nr:hypothetical protein [Candidatus Colimorpha onthohippi]